MKTVEELLAAIRRLPIDEQLFIRDEVRRMLAEEERTMGLAGEAPEDASGSSIESTSGQRDPK